MIVSESICQRREYFIEQYGDLTGEAEYNCPLAFFYGAQDVTGAFFGCHELAFVQDAFAAGLAFVVKGGVADIAGDESGAGPHDMDAGVEQLGAEGFEPALEREFRGGVSASAGEATVAGNGGDTNDGAFSFQDGREGVFGTIYGSEEVDLHDFTGYFGDRVEKEGAHADAGVVDEDVDASEGFDGGFDEAAAFLFVADVAGNGVEEDAGIFHLELIDLVVISTAGGDLGAEGDEGFDQRFADAIATTCDHDYFILEERHIYGLWLQTYEFMGDKHKNGRWKCLCSGHPQC